MRTHGTDTPIAEVASASSLEAMASRPGRLALKSRAATTATTTPT